MRYKRLKLSYVLLLGIGLTGLHAQTMYVKESNGTQTAYTLSNVKKMTFSSGNVVVQKTDNSNNVYALSDLRYLNFTDLSTSIVEQTVPLKSTNLIAYPNPVNDFLTIDFSGFTDEGTISILTLEGKLLLEQNNKGATSLKINLSHLPGGVYICLFSNTTEVKAVKIIKQ